MGHATQIISKIHTALVYDEDRGSGLCETLVPVKKTTMRGITSKKTSNLIVSDGRELTVFASGTTQTINFAAMDTAIRVVHAVRLTQIKAKQCTAYKGCM